MSDILTLAASNLISPIILSFALGLAAALARSDLSVPEAVAKGMSIYLLFAIGFKGGAGVAAHGLDGTLVATLVAGLILSFALPFIGFALLGLMTRLNTVDRAAVAAHYGSISIVTFVAATSVLESQGIAAEGYMVATAAVMEAPAILSALWIIGRSGGGAAPAGLYREILLNGSIVLLVGSFLIGAITGAEGWPPSPPLSSRHSRGCCASSCWIWALSPGAACARRVAPSARARWPLRSSCRPSALPLGWRRGSSSASLRAAWRC